MRVTRGYWKNIHNIKKEFDMLEEKHGVVTWSLIRKLKCNALASAWMRMKDDFEKEYPDFHIEATTKPKGFYQDIENIRKEIREIHEHYGCIPPNEVLIKISSLHSIARFGFSLSKIIGEMYPNERKISRLEDYCKKILDKYIKNEPFVDNGRKALLNYGIDLQNKDTKQWFQIDRFYINQRVAIEIQGKQHYKAGNKDSIWTQERTDRIQEIDAIKEKRLKDIGVHLIKIKWTLATEENILTLLKESGKFSL